MCMELRDLYNMAIMFITHDLGLAYFASDRIYIMFKGKIIEEGTPESILNNPQHDYTKKLLESVPKLYRKWY